MSAISRAKARERRKKRIRVRVKGRTGRPRLSVFRSAKHIYAQIIDDEVGKTLLSVSSLSKDLRDQVSGKGGNKEGAAIVGEMIAKRALEKGIKKVVFDRNGFLYHGRVKTLAESARNHGLDF
ncbi:MAG: 50S ribosomal protein L18 [Deltaproteobacteria bacterium]|nr:50S ribosomal protein L18 [Deltaproteobacteria bacterium]MBW2016232.1 50S ribosomal protein L18 [Deltaproteobacteria bacterium]MBW2130052.1 50S ribosomal protein L18 [Deltaproteobacteria bacterium]MBW2304308.1 50S ribosomal protein L18 [Deltaproteobacteria bacterium]